MIFMDFPIRNTFLTFSPFGKPRLTGATVLPALGQARAGGQDFVEGRVLQDLPVLRRWMAEKRQFDGDFEMEGLKKTEKMM
jgi:hypothetical protein